MKYHPNPPHGKQVKESRYYQFMEANGASFIYSGDAVLVIPLTQEGNVLLGIERNAAFNRDLLLATTGSIEEGESLEETANRELQEELGWKAQRIDFLGELYLSKYLTTRMFAFLARDLVASKLEGDERYPIGTFSTPLANFMDLCQQGMLYDASTIAALSLAQRFLEKEASTE